MLLLAVVLLRLLLRIVWVADLIAAVILAFITGTGGRTPGDLIFYTVAGLVAVWALRQFGFLAMLWRVYFFNLLTTSAIFTFAGSFAGASLAIQLLPMAAAAWALWVIATQAKPANVAML